jgi:putative lipoprotein
LIGGILLVGSGSVEAQTITGTATYLARIAMPQDAVFEATLLDVSRTDVPADEIASTRIESPGNPPIKFAIKYDPARIIDGHTYSVRATIRVRGELMFTTDQAYPVLSRGVGSTVAMTLRLAKGAQPPQPPQPVGPGATIEGIRWRATILGETKVTLPSGPREPHLTFQAGGRVSGADGCNTLTGLYEISAKTIRIGPLAGTLMTCANANGIDRQFREAIGTATGWKATATELELLDAKGTVLAKFEAK